MGVVNIFGFKLRINSAPRYAHDRVFYKVVNKYLREGIDVLDIGSGYARTYMELFRNTTYETLDISKDAHPTYLMDIQKDVPKKKYDLVIALNLLEHIKETEACVKNIKVSLKSGGVLIGSAPFLYPIHSNEDYYRFTKKGLQYQLGKYFKSVEIYPYGNFMVNFIRMLGSVKYISIPFNLTANFWEWLFHFYKDEKSPSGYVFVCKN